MLKKIKLTQLSLAITFTGLFVLSWLIFNRDVIRLLEKPISAIGNMPENYLVFLLGSGLVFYFLTLFLIKTYKLEKIKIGWELYALPILVLLTLIIPYREDLILAKILHTTTGVLGAIVIMFIMYKINKQHIPENPLIKKITKHTPIITIIGTITLFIITGLSTIMQLFYLSASIIWINLIAFSKTKKKNKK